MSYTQNWSGEFIKNTAILKRKSLERVLEIGVFEGLTSNYIVDNLLADNGILICVDPLDTNYELDSDNILFKGQYERFIENTDYNKGRITLFRESSLTALIKMSDNYFDLIFVDGDHTKDSVYTDANNAFRICKVYGLILFDDYEWGGGKPVKEAVDLFLSEHKNHRLLLKLNQVLIQKLPEGSETEDAQEWYQSESIKIHFGWDKIHGEYCNLDIRPDRNEKMIAELNRVGLQDVIKRRRSFPWQELWDSYNDEEKERVGVMHRRTAGAIGCHFSQVAVMEEALKQGKHAWVCEDDLVFCDDMHERLDIIFKFLNTHEWDIFWFGGTYHIDTWWHKLENGEHTNSDLTMCHCTLNKDFEETDNPNIRRTYGAFSTHCYLVNKDRIPYVLQLLDHHVHWSMGIDWIMILEQPNLNCYAFNPGCVIQHDNQSNIGNGISVFSGFARLGEHWFKPLMDKK